MTKSKIKPKVAVKPVAKPAGKGVPVKPVIPESAKRLKYNIKWKPIMDPRTGRIICQQPDVLIERLILRNYDKLIQMPSNELMSWEEHFKKFVSHVLGRRDWQHSWHWNPYAERILRHIREEKLLAVSGHASSGKSAFFAMYAVCMFLIFPENTKVFVTSTTLKDSRNRVWGEIERMWNEAERYMISLYTALKLPVQLPGKLVHSAGKITGIDSRGKTNDLSGIALLAGEEGSGGDSTLIGFKSPNLLLLADELPMLSHKLYAATSNLMSNKGFKMVASGNFGSCFDPMGVFSEPKDGWNSVTESDFEWRTKKGGLCIRFDGAKSPNIVAGKVVYPGLLAQLEYDSIVADNPVGSPGYYRMIKSFPCPTGAVSTLYSEPELNANLCQQNVNQWLTAPTPLGFLDPAFSKGGDAAAASFGKVGVAQINGVDKVMLEKTETLDLMKRVNARHATKDVNEQLADLFIEECEKRGIAVLDRGVDATGGGDPFASILAMKQGHGMQLVSFAGAASEKVVSATDKRTGFERFANKVSELWGIGREFVASGQIRGLDPSTMIELCTRTFTEGTGKAGKRLLVEPKDEMKKRTNGRSPDRADSWVGLIEIARRRHKFVAAARAAVIAKPVGPVRPWFMPPEPPKPTFRDHGVNDMGWGGGKSSGWGE